MQPELAVPSSLAVNAMHAKAVTNGAASPNGAGSPNGAANSNGAEAIPFSAEQYQTLQTLATEQGITLSDAVDQAIKIAKIIVEAHRAPGKRVLIATGKRLQELTLR